MTAGAWDRHYQGLSSPAPYGFEETYRVAADWVAGLSPIEDWGCGKGWLRRLVDPDAYVGVDGSSSPFADCVADLEDYRSSTAQAIVLRHVLEHNYRWEKILDNALASPSVRKLVIVLFTLLRDETTVLWTEPEYQDVPVIGFRLSDITDRLGRFEWKTTTVRDETVLLVERRADKPKAKPKRQPTLARKKTSSGPTVVYSALYGRYDPGIHPAPSLAGVDFVVFTDDEKLEAPGWEVRVVPSSETHSRYAAKWFKCLPHRALPDATQTLWIDASHKILSPDAVGAALGCLETSPVAAHDHSRGCIYPEAEHSATYNKYVGTPVIAQAEAYRAEGHPEGWGLWACGSLARRRTPELDGAMDDWWSECKKWTYQDQISFPVVLRRAGLRPASFPHNQYASPWFAFYPHLRED